MSINNINPSLPTSHILEEKLQEGLHLSTTGANLDLHLIELLIHFTPQFLHLAHLDAKLLLQLLLLFEHLPS